MNDRPNLPEMLDAVRYHLETNIIPAVKGDARLYFQTLIAVNLLKIAGREAEMGYTLALETWTTLGIPDAEVTLSPDELQQRLETYYTDLGDAIRRGEHDDDIHVESALYAQMRTLTERALTLNNPKFLETLATEDAAQS